MKASFISKLAMGCSCCVMLMSPTGIFADNPLPVPQQKKTVAVSTTRDIELASGGTFKGSIMNAEGLALAGTEVSLTQGSEQIAKAVTDQEGRFELTNLRGGVYVLSAGNTQESVRLWAENTAPPAAENEIALVSSPQVVRGQFGGLDLFTAVALGAAITGVTFAALNYDDLQDLEDKVDKILASL